MNAEPAELSGATLPLTRSNVGPNQGPAHFSFWTTGEGSATTAEAGAPCARRPPNPTELTPWPEPKTDRSAATDTNPPCSSNPPPYGPPLPSAVAHSDLPSAVGTGAAKPPYWAIVSPPATALLSLAPRAHLLPPALIALPLEGRVPPRPASYSAGQPPHSTRCRDSARRLRHRAAMWYAPACGRFRRATPRPVTYTPPLPSRPVPHLTPCVAWPNTFTLRWPAFLPARGRVYPHRRPRLADSKAPPAELLPIAGAASGLWAAENPNSPPESGGSPQMGPMDFLNHPRHGRDSYRSESRKRRGMMAFCAAFSRGAQK